MPQKNWVSIMSLQNVRSLFGAWKFVWIAIGPSLVIGIGVHVDFGIGIVIGIGLSIG